MHGLFFFFFSRPFISCFPSSKYQSFSVSLSLSLSTSLSIFVALSLSHLKTCVNHRYDMQEKLRQAGVRATEQCRASSWDDAAEWVAQLAEKAEARYRSYPLHSFKSPSYSPFCVLSCYLVTPRLPLFSLSLLWFSRVN